MYQHQYWLVTENGDLVMEIKGEATYLSFDIYAQKYIVPMLPPPSEGMGERVYFTDPRQEFGE